MIRSVLIVVGFLGVVSVSIAEQPGKAPAPTAPTNATSPRVRSATQHAWDDLRWLMTALEAYSTDNDSHYAPADGPRDGVVSDLDGQLGWYYSNTFPSRPARPAVDPWGRKYRFVISGTRKLYALYSLGPEGTLDGTEAKFLESLKKDNIRDEELKEHHASRNVIVVSGTLIFAPPDVLEQLQPAR